MIKAYEDEPNDRYVEINNNLWYYIKDRETLIKYDISEVVDLLNEQDKTIKELNKYCISQEDTLVTILEYVDALLRGLEFDLYVYDYFEIIRNLEMDRMNAFIREFAVGGEDG